MALFYLHTALALAGCRPLLPESDARTLSQYPTERYY